MNPDKTAARKATALSWIIILILALLPFHAFLTVWLSSLVGHYTLLRLWKEILLIPVFAGVVYLLSTNRYLRKKLFDSWLTRIILIYALLLLTTGFIAFFYHDVTTKALAYGELADLRFLFFFLAVMVICAFSPLLRQKWRATLLLPATLVVIFGLLQYWVLPNDFLRHFGYGHHTITIYETINNNLNSIRIGSTLRGANPLGAYMVLVISAAVSLLMATSRKRPSQFLWLLGAFLVLVFSYSRSAWIGAALSVAIILWVSLESARLRRWLLVAGGTLVVFACAAGFMLRNNTTFQYDTLHTDSRASTTMTSNQGHAIAFRRGIHDIVHQPLGGGTGTAGPASVYNNQPGRVAENYFLQVGQEAGVVGMGLFLAINIMVGLKLWRQRREPLALALFASLIGLSFVNMLSHAWTDDTLAYIWWGLAGISLSPVILNHKGNNSAKKIKATA